MFVLMFVTASDGLVNPLETFGWGWGKREGGGPPTAVIIEDTESELDSRIQTVCSVAGYRQ